MKNFIMASIALAALAGCATKNAIPVEYRGGVVSKLPMTNSAPIGVTQWTDSRTIASSNDDMADRAVMKLGPHTIGIKSKGREFYRVADFVRDNFIQEMAAQGANIRPIEVNPSVNDFNILSKIAKSNQVDYIIGGDIGAFDVSCNGAWTLECSRKVSITISAITKDGAPIITRETFDATQSNNEGMGVMHSTVLDQITNNVMRQALEKAINRTIEVLNGAQK